MIFKVEGQCPKCAQKGKRISIKKMRHHVDDISFLHDEFEYHVCRNSKCEVVYFNIINEFTTFQLNKEIGYKQNSSNNANICYCYNIKKSDLNEHTIGYIETKMEEYPCECKIRNPYGNCCKKHIKQLMKETIDTEH